MSLSRKLTADQPAQNIGARAEPTGEKRGGVFVVSGKTAERKERGHENVKQAIRHRLELRTDLKTTVRSAEIRPGDYSSYVIRADGTLGITLSPPPSVPAIQTAEGIETRRRKWDVDLLVYFASETTVTWPGAIAWGTAFEEVEIQTGTQEEPAAESVLTLAPGPRPATYPAGTSARFRLEYWEETAQWYGFEIMFGAAGADPDDSEDPGTEPEPDPEDPGDEGNEDTPDHDYTDPDTGDPIVPEQPAVGAGDLVALHGGAISRTTDAGHTWRRFDGPTSPFNFAALSGEGVVVSTIGGQAFHSLDLAGWREIELESEAKTEIPVENGDFETGDLTGWNLVSGNEPVVLDTVQPPQRDGSFYLTRDHSIDGPYPFKIEKKLSIPPEVKDIRVSADMMTSFGSAAALRIFGRNAASINLFNDPSSTSSKSRGDSWRFRNVAQKDGRSIDAITTITNAFWASYRYKPRQGGIEYDYGADFEWAVYRFDFVDSVTGDSVELGGKFRLTNFFSQTGTDNGNPRSAAFHMTPEFIDTSYGNGGFKVVSGDENHISLGSSNGLLGFGVSPGTSVDVVVSILPTTSFTARIKHNANSGDNVLNISGYEGVGEIGSVLAPISNTLSKSSLDVELNGSGDELFVQLEGQGDADVYFDNVKVEALETRDETIAAVARDIPGRRFVITTSESIHTWRKPSGAMYIGPTPFKAFFVSSRSDVVVIADQENVAISEDAGLSFTTFQRSGVTQVFAHPQPLVVLDTGQVLGVSSAGLEPIFTADPGSYITYDAKRKQFYITMTGPDVAKTKSFSVEEAHSSMPRSATAGNGASDRGLLALDSGRLIAWKPFSRDLLHYDSTAGKWLVSKPLTEAIQDIQELK